MNKFFCYLFHRKSFTVIFAVDASWPFEILIDGFEWFCPRCDRWRGRSVMANDWAGLARRLPSYGVPA